MCTFKFNYLHHKWPVWGLLAKQFKPPKNMHRVPLPASLFLLSLPLRLFSTLLAAFHTCGGYSAFAELTSRLKVGSVILDERFLRAIFSKIHNLSPPFETTPPKYMNALLLLAKCSDVPEIENETCRDLECTWHEMRQSSTVRLLLLAYHYITEDIFCNSVFFSSYGKCSTSQWS